MLSEEKEVSDVMTYCFYNFRKDDFFYQKTSQTFIVDHQGPVVQSLTKFLKWH